MMGPSSIPGLASSVEPKQLRPRDEWNVLDRCQENVMVCLQNYLEARA